MRMLALIGMMRAVCWGQIRAAATASQLGRDISHRNVGSQIKSPLRMRAKYYIPLNAQHLQDGKDESSLEATFTNSSILAAVDNEQKPASMSASKRMGEFSVRRELAEEVAS